MNEIFLYFSIDSNKRIYKYVVYTSLKPGEIWNKHQLENNKSAFPSFTYIQGKQRVLSWLCTQARSPSL